MKRRNYKSNNNTQPGIAHTNEEILTRVNKTGKRNYLSYEYSDTETSVDESFSHPVKHTLT
jgi:hypothetical protein